MSRASRFLRYFWAPVAVALALGIRAMVQPVLGTSAPYPLFILAVFCASVFGGFGPGILATVLGGLAAMWFVIPPLHQFAIHGLDNQIGLVVYLGTSLLIVLLVDAQHKAKLAAESSARMAGERQRYLEIEVLNRERAEAAERTQREWLQVLLASIGDAVLATDSEGRLTLMNPTASALTGWSREEGIGKSIEAVFNIRNEETDATVENPALRAMREGRIVGLANHTVLIRKDGQRIFIDDSGAPIVDSSGQVRGAILVFRDISDAKAREAELRRRDRIIGWSHDGIIISDAERRIKSWNRGAAEMYGWTEAEALGKVTHDLLKSRNSKQMAEIDEALRECGRWDGELVHTCKDGSAIVTESRHVLLRDPQGEITGILEINRDITDRKRTEEELRRVAAEAEEGRRTLQALLEHIPEGITVADAPDVRIRMISRHGAELTGRPAEALVQIPAEQHPAAWGLYHTDGRTPARPEELPLTRAVAVGETATDEEWVIERPDGTPVPILCNAAPIRDAEGNITGGLLAWRDISQRRQMEEKLRETAKLESLGVLAGGIAHDFNNLLTGVMGNASLLLDDLPENSPTWRIAEGIAKAAERAARLTQQMLAYSGRGRFFVEPVDLSKQVRETTALIAASIPKNVELKLDLADNLPLVNADVAQLQQLVMNLAINGAEAIGDQSGRLAIVTSARQIDETYLRTLRAGQNVQPGLYVVVEVQDTGRGMDEETIARIFDPFFTTKFTGRGLGLSAVQGIVQGHSGAIKVYSTPGAGTTIRVLLPVAASAQPQTEPAHPAPVSRCGAGTVLVVDDEEIVRATAKSALEKLGYRVLLACNGQEGVRALQMDSGICLVLLDMTMPGLSGEETLRRMRQINTAVPVLVSSGFSEEEALRHFGKQNFSGFIEKPYTVQSLAEKAKAAIAK